MSVLTKSAKFSSPSSSSCQWCTAITVTMSGMWGIFGRSRRPTPLSTTVPASGTSVLVLPPHTTSTFSNFPIFYTRVNIKFPKSQILFFTNEKIFSPSPLSCTPQKVVFCLLPPSSPAPLTTLPGSGPWTLLLDHWHDRVSGGCGLWLVGVAMSSLSFCSLLSCEKCLFKGKEVVYCPVLH